MNLVQDSIYPTPGGGHCRIRLYLPDEPQDAAVVICTEPASERLSEGNEGMSITNCAEVLAAQVIEANRLQLNPVWIEHYEDGARGTVEEPNTFDLVTFSSYEPFVFVGVKGPQWRIGRPSWQALDRRTVERLIGAEL